MNERKLFKLLLDNTFFTENKHLIIPEFFANDLTSLFTTLCIAHEEFNRTITPLELIELHFSNNPALSEAAKNSLNILVDNISEEETVGSDVAQTLIKQLYKEEVARLISNAAIKIVTGQDNSFVEVKRLIEKYGDNSFELQTSELQPISGDVNDILDGTKDTSKFSFNITQLAEEVGGIGPGIFTIVYARPEAGKTGFWVSLVAAANGFAHQGAKIHAILNEEPAKRTASRILSACTELPISEIEINKEEVQRQYDLIKDNISLYDAVGISIEEIETHVGIHKPDILIFDQLDKVRISGIFARDDLKLRELYIRAREIAKKYCCAVIAFSQASAEAQNRGVLSFDMMEGSKTGKAAEADLVIGIGFNPHNYEIRALNINKNKLTGKHPVIYSQFRTEVSIYV